MEKVFAIKYNILVKEMIHNLHLCSDDKSAEERKGDWGDFSKKFSIKNIKYLIFCIKLKLSILFFRGEGSECTVASYCTCEALQKMFHCGICGDVFPV